MSSTVVIKVKYGDMLRRFNSPVVDDKLVLSLDELRMKIISLFSFAPDTEMMLTYLDEDDDVVTIVDDDDLHDAMKQYLNPFRITVKLNNQKTGSQYANSTASSTPLRSPRVQPPLPNPNAGISDILRVSEVLSKVPGPLQEALVKISDDLASKAASSPTPGISELVELLSKVSLSYLSKPTESQSEGKTGAPESSTSVEETKNSENLQKPVPVPTMEERIEVESQKETGQSTKASPFDFNAVSAALDSTNELRKTLAQHHGAITQQLLRKKEKAKKLMASAVDKTLIGKAGVGKPSEPKLGTSAGDYQARWGGKAPTHIWAPPLGAPNYFGPTESLCPFSGTAMGGPPCLNVSQKDVSGNSIHRGVCCDGCDAHPIVGPRFKSKVKVDYDLCSTCFEEIGNVNDYIRMDRPAALPHMYMKGLHDSRVRHHPHIFRGPKCKVGALKFDSRFIQDVNIFDGTVMAPLTPFTKIWKMRNNGTLLWPAKTQLVWIGGDKLSNTLSVELPVPSAGLPLEHELDVAVDFISPVHPGRYISYWRMASPSGQKFGQRVWVLIQVDASLKEDTTRENVRNLNLNLPPVGSSSTGPEIITLLPRPVVEDNQVVDDIKKAAKVEKPDADQELKFPINDSLFVGNGASTSVASSSASSPVPQFQMIDFSDVVPLRVVPPSPLPAFTPPPPPPTLPSAPVGQPAAEVVAKNEVEEKLLRELEEMGFKQIDLNKEVLRSNEYDLEQAVDELCGVGDWDPILEELNEMGFNDEEMNLKLLRKNNGSIKRVVMDLIAGEKN